MKPHLKYLSYVIRHKWFVFVAGLRIGAPLWRLIIHDWSKFLPSEWFPYAVFFYATKPVPAYGDQRYFRDAKSPAECDDIVLQRQKAFDRAWLLHQHRSPHHWQYWVLREDDGATKVLQMPEHFAREMLADWAGAGRAITGKWGSREWYEKTGGTRSLHPTTLLFVEGHLR